MTGGNSQPSGDLPLDSTATFWAFAAAGEFRVQECAACQSVLFPPRGICRGCHGTTLEWVPAPRQGVVHSFTINRREWVPGQKVPNAICLVEFDLGQGRPFRVLGVGTPAVAPDGWAIGLPVTIRFDFPEGSDPVPVFELHNPHRPPSAVHAQVEDVPARSLGEAG
jgi:uncharacterized protein